jgi:predicted glycosyltransferase
MRRQARALIHVQHLLGLGHLARAARLATAMAADGFDVTMAMGGVAAGVPAPPGIRIVQLDPVRVAPDAMTILLAADGQIFDAERQARRRDVLLELFEAIAPDVLVIEAFPFGRRMMRFELMPLLERAQGRCLVAASIRDILQENRKPGRHAETCAVVEAFVDCVLVHGEQAVTPLSLTFPLADRIAGRTHYTGMIGPPAPEHPVRGHEIVVSAGGGAVGGPLLAAAAVAVSRPRFKALRSLLLTGPNLPAAEAGAIQAASGPRTELRRFVDDFPARLAGAQVSVSQAGYNTVADLIAARCPAVLVPFAAGGETEQPRRAKAMAAAGRAIVLDDAALDPDRLEQALAAALALPRPPAGPALDGAMVSSRLLRQRIDLDRTG